MNCSDDITDLKGLTQSEIINILKKERNSFAKSRDKWREAAFILWNHEDDTKLQYLMREEMCQKCQDYYHSLQIKTDILF